MTQVNPTVGEEKGTKIVLSPCGPARKEQPTSPKRTSSSGMQRASRIRGMATIENTKYFLERVRKIIETKRTPQAADAEFHCCFDDKLNSYMLAGVRQNV